VAHRRAKLTVEGRLALVDRIVNQGWPPARAAEAQCVSVATAYKWLRRWNEEGLPGLQDRSSRPHVCPRRLPLARETAIVEMRVRHRVGPHRIAWVLGESRSTVYAVLRRHRMPRLAHLDRPTGRPVRYEKDRPGELIHVDVKKLGRIPEGGGHRILGRAGGGKANANRQRRRQALGYDFLHAAIDDKTRIAYVEVHDDESSMTAAGFASRMLSFYRSNGIEVERVMTDNGACYRSRVFRDALVAGRAHHTRTRPYRPRSNGKVERFNRTLNDEWAYSSFFATNADRLATLEGWIHCYNHHRPHGAHGGSSPMSFVNNVSENHS
jgi:transposase InsO family protein